MTQIVKKISHFTKKEINQLFKTARRITKHPGFTILLAPQLHDFGRILIVASRKVGNAPTRNKIKRRLKAIFYEEKLYERGYDCIVIVKKEGTIVPHAELKQLLTQAFEQAEQLNT